MSRVIGSLNWRACQDCKFTDQIQGGCTVGVPDDIFQMEIDYDLIECTCFEQKEADK